MSRTRILLIIVGLVLVYTGYIKRPQAAPPPQKAECLAFVAGQQFKCAFGRSGVSLYKREGDGATPVGTFPLRRAFYRADRVNLAEIATTLPLKAIDQKDGWIDDPKSPYYNQYTHLPSPYGHEELWQNDYVYDLIVVVGYNDQPAIKNKGSAIFIHIARPDYSPTAGCIAFAKDDLLKILKYLNPQTRVEIHSNGHVYFYDAKTKDQ